MCIEYKQYLELPTLLLAYQCNSPDFTWLMALLHRKIKSIDESNERKSQTNPNHQYFNGLKERYEKFSKLLEQYPEQAINGKEGTDNPQSDFHSLNVDGFAKKCLPKLTQILLQQGFSQTNTTTEPSFTRQTEYGEQALNLRVGGGQGTFIISGDISLIVSKLYPYYEQLQLPYQVSKPLLNVLLVTIPSSKLPYTVSSEHDLNHFCEQFQNFVIEKINMLQTFSQLDYFIDDGQPLVFERGWWLKNKFQ